MASAEDETRRLIAEKKEQLEELRVRVKAMAQASHERYERAKEKDPDNPPRVDRGSELKVHRQMQALTKEIEGLEARLKDGMAAP